MKNDLSSFSAIFVYRGGDSYYCCYRFIRQLLVGDSAVSAKQPSSDCNCYNCIIMESCCWASSSRLWSADIPWKFSWEEGRYSSVYCLVELVRSYLSSRRCALQAARDDDINYDVGCCWLFWKQRIPDSDWRMKVFWKCSLWVKFSARRTKSCFPIISLYFFVSRILGCDSLSNLAALRISTVRPLCGNASSAGA